ncbi:MAG TPA: EamA family transporter, partial [Gaiellaceae bacterium]|nr:EamA family transporter [Gaiellaceae bacterium]
ALVGMPGGGSSPIRAAAVVASAALYALAALYGGRALGHVQPLLVATGSLLAAALLTAPLGIAQAPDHLPGWKVVGSMLALGIGGTAVAYVIYYGLIVGAGASKAILVTYLVPPIAVAYGAVILGESVRPEALGGLALILGGVALGTGNVRLLRRRQAATAST